MTYLAREDRDPRYWEGTGEGAIIGVLEGIWATDIALGRREYSLRLSHQLHPVVLTPFSQCGFGSLAHVRVPGVQQSLGPK